MSLDQDIEDRTEDKSKDHLTFRIAYNIEKDDLEITGDIKPEAYSGLISDFLRGQMGAGKDDSEAIERDTYHITLKWYPERDDIVVSSDTGNKGLRDGILYHVLNKLND